MLFDAGAAMFQTFIESLATKAVRRGEVRRIRY
jgi:hypothetical protein